MRDGTLNLYVVRDIKAATIVGSVIHAVNPTPIVRALSEAVNDGKSIVAKNPEDFEVWHIGIMDDETAEILPLEEGPQRLTTALALRQAQS